jgi:predicted O-linked N-acetylglucosamine transferase (SPINDLY family)
MNACDTFVDLKETTFTQSAERIAADGVDILVDLTGYTTHARMEILALRPAPIQVHYWGYPGTLGVSFIDYNLVDEFVVPAEHETFFAEKLVRLPGCYVPSDSQCAISLQTPSKRECGLPDDGFVFCSFNNSYKVTPEVFDIWMKLLQAVPASVLWLLEGNRFVPPNLKKEAERRGVAGDRLVFLPRLPPPDYLARFRLADLFLDTLPYNGHTTVRDALWVGCPALTRTGTTFASRVAGSLLRAVGLPELITTETEEYYDLALHLARDADRLTELRGRLASNRKTSPLFDGANMARNMERAYSTMWEIHASGQPPRGFAVSGP